MRFIWQHCKLVSYIWYTVSKRKEFYGKELLKSNKQTNKTEQRTVYWKLDKGLQYDIRTNEMR